MLSALRRGQDALRLLDIQQFKFQGHVEDGYEPKTDSDEENTTFQMKKAVTSSSLLELDEENTDQKSYLFRVEIELGVRYVYNLPQSDPTQEDSILAQIEAGYRVDYVITNNNICEDHEALDEFALQNAPHHVWSFWREFVDSQSNRMRLPRALIPMMASLNSK